MVKCLGPLPESLLVSRAVASRTRTWIAYLAVLLLFAAGMLAVFVAGARLATPGPIPAAGAASVVIPAGEESSSRWRPMYDNLRQPLAVLLLQVIVIVAFARGVGALFGRFGQPAVVGEMLAGILLGPSLFGWLLPDLQAWVFPVGSLDPLKMLSQFGVILFMFVVGIDLDVAHLREKAHATLLVSHVSIVAPFLLGSAAALAVYPTLAPAGVAFAPFALFLGVSMSVTAFPVLARILEERKLSRTTAGTTSIACAAVGDATAWCVLAVIVAHARSSSLAGAAMTVVFALLFVVGIWFLVKPSLARLQPTDLGRSDSRSPGRLAMLLVFVFCCALVTETIGVHALFGAFLAGVILPPDPEARRWIKERLETFSGAVLLPLFFAFTGLRTDVGRLSDGSAWLTCLGLTAVAIAGKLGAGALAARWTGLSWLDALAVGSLMNTRGLVELIVLSLGLELGILSPEIFTMLVVMALATTLMTGPLLSVIERRRNATSPAG